MERKNSIGIFPTGYGKSVCFQIVPLIHDAIYVLYINLAQNRRVEDVNNHFQKCSMKVTFRKRN
jgi:hypothetical protein